MWDKVLSSVMEGKVEEAGRLFEESAKSFFEPGSQSMGAKSKQSDPCPSDITVTVDNTTANVTLTIHPKFLEAAKKGNVEEVKRTAEAGANLDARDSNGMSALHLAAWNGHIHVVKYLLSKGASPQAKSKHGSTPVHAASEKGYTDIVRLLLDHDEQEQPPTDIYEERQPSVSEGRK